MFYDTEKKEFLYHTRGVAMHISRKKCTTKEIRGTSDISISLSVSRHPF